METSIVAAPGDTWGIPGPQFLWLYFGLAAVAIIGVLIWRRSITGGPSLRSARDLTPTQAALINGDRRLAVYSSLAALRTAGSIETDKQGKLRQTAIPPTGAPELDRAIYSVAANGITTTGVQTHPTVRAVLDRAESELAQAGWILDSQARRTVRMGALVVFAVVALGIARVFAGIANERPVTNLVLMMIPVLVIALFLLGVPRVSSSGKRLLARMRSAAQHLSPGQKPSWATYGPQAAALSVGLFGVGAFLVADPAFAAEAELQRNIALTGSGYSGGSTSYGCSSSSSGDSGSSSSCSSGSSCGSSCGGGGCGG
ncbi:TIGR04222 domain-containing membrane protein [Dactylosporangium vinaceum]|uniref:TIGR04222 domain-containing membrane protein n=1 Tax=Dactylosporangium vinaceum TaxID=53362 RepID=A0ABV5MBI3_9ACTN|nr:TIGR04222 domain-containing membrane protein [Dactylosporangium vinaceum]UAB98446.1 TIGR04222 domain-containing membrane protein [Dactylosporangium vinaceum]